MASLKFPFVGFTFHLEFEELDKAMLKTRVITPADKRDLKHLKDFKKYLSLFKQSYNEAKADRIKVSLIGINSQRWNEMIMVLSLIYGEDQDLESLRVWYKKAEVVEFENQKDDEVYMEGRH